MLISTSAPQEVMLVGVGRDLGREEKGVEPITSNSYIPGMGRNSSNSIDASPGA
jgi:hypothetical protein